MSRRALLLVGAVAVVLAFLGGYLLLGGSGDDRVPPTARPSSSAPASAPATAAPSVEPSPSPSPAYDAVDLLLTADEAGAADEGSAAYAEGGAVEDGALLDPCPGGTAYPRDADRVDRASRELVSDEEGGSTGLQQQVARYRSAQAAADAFEGYRRAVGACPTITDESVTARHELVDSEPRGGAETFLVRWSSTDSAEPGAATLCCFEYYAVQVAGDAVSVLVAGSGGDGDPTVDLLLPFAAATGERLTATAG